MNCSFRFLHEILQYLPGPLNDLSCQRNLRMLRVRGLLRRISFFINRIFRVRRTPWKIHSECSSIPHKISLDFFSRKYFSRHYRRPVERDGASDAMRSLDRAECRRFCFLLRGEGRRCCGAATELAAQVGTRHSLTST